MVIRKLQKRDINEVAKLHTLYLTEGVIAHMGKDFLAKFYTTLLNQNNIFTIVADANGKVIAFATGATDLGIIPKILLKNLWLQVIITVMQNTLIILKLVQMPFYPSFKGGSKNGEIFSIAVDPSFRNRGVGLALINACKKEFKKRNCSFFQLSVRKRMTGANAFYQKLNFKKMRTSKFLGEEIIFYGKKV